MLHDPSASRCDVTQRIPPVEVHLEHEKTAKDRDPVMGVVSTWYGNPYRIWSKVHLDDDVIEQGIYWEGSGRVEHDEHLWLPLPRVTGRMFETGIAPENYDALIQKTATMLMAHKSGAEGGRPAGIDEIEEHSLPRYITEKA